MKTIHTIYKYMLVLILMMIGAQQLQAQDAFYIYRNDGGFNGFFFDQIVRMGYSKTDLEGEEHDVYVVQEIETIDSLYRIPLAAIDSIGFQQPEIRFSPRLKNMDELGMTPYARFSQSDMCVCIDDEIPSSLVPVVGDVLLSYDEKIQMYGAPENFGFDPDDDYFYQEGFFVGKVKEVKNIMGTWYTYCEPVDDLSDIFDQFISVEQVGYDESGNVRRRVAGFNSDGTLKTQTRGGGNFDVTLFSFSGRLQKEWKPMSDMSVSVGLDLGMEAKLQAVYSITGVFKKRMYVELNFTEEFSAGASIIASIGQTCEVGIPTPLSVLPGIKFPAVFPIFEVNPIPIGFFRVGGYINGKLSFPTYKCSLAQTVTIDTDDPWIMSFSWGSRDTNSEENKIVDDKFEDIDLSMSFTGFVQGGVKSTFGLETNSWLSKLLHAGIGLDIYAGPKLTGSLSSTLANTYIEWCNMSIDRELNYKWRVGTKKEQRTLWSDTKQWDVIRLYAAPQFPIKSEANYDEASKTATLTVFPRGTVFGSSEIGIAVETFDDNLKKHEHCFYGTEYAPGVTPEKYTVEITADTLWAGSYYYYPCVRDNKNKKRINIDDIKNKSTFEITAKCEDDFKNMDLGHEGGTFTFNVKGNSYFGYNIYTNGYVPIQYEEKCLAKSKGDASYQYTFTVLPNEYEHELEGEICYGPKLEKTIKVRQKGKPKSEE